MGDVVGFVKRLTGPNRIRWSPEDIEKLRKIYGLTEKQAAEIVLRHYTAETQLLPSNKSASLDAPLKWKFTASDGTVDRVGDIVSVVGINLKNYVRNPIWHFGHDHKLPVGMAPNTYKEGGKLKSVLELGVGVYPYAETLQNALVKGMCRACSISFLPLKWSYAKERDGINFAEIDLLEISAVTVPCCAGAILDGPVKSLSPAAAKRQRTLELIKLKAGC